MKYIQFTEEQKMRASKADLAEFLQSRGETLKRSGREFIWNCENEKVTVKGNLWYNHYTGEGGNSISFLKKFYHMAYPEAVQVLLGERIAEEQITKPTPTAETTAKTEKLKAAIIIPPKNNTMNRVFAYLNKERFIDRDFIKFFAQKGLLYEEEKYHNAVFVGLDKSGNIRHIHKRGTYSNGEPYKGNAFGSDPKYSFHHIGASDTVFVFEAPIDVLSYITLNSENWEKHSYIALCSVAEHCLLQTLKDYPNIKNVNLCLDHDKAGISACYRLNNLICNKVDRVSIIQPKYKDFNEDLKAIHGVKPLLGVDDESLQDLENLVQEMKYDISKYKGGTNLLQNLKADLYRLSREDIDDDILKNIVYNMAIHSYSLAKRIDFKINKNLTMSEDCVLSFYTQYNNSLNKENYMKQIKTESEKILNSLSTTRTESEFVCIKNQLLKLSCECLQLVSKIEQNQQQSQDFFILNGG